MVGCFVFFGGVGAYGCCVGGFEDVAAAADVVDIVGGWLTWSSRCLC